MIKSLERQLLHPCVVSSSCGIQSLVLPNFVTQQSSNDYISSLCKQNLFKEALEAFDLLREKTNHHVNPSTGAHLISACSSLKSLDYGKKIYNHILTSNCQPDMILQNHILNMYGKCGSLKDAQKLFDEMTERNVVSWTSLIAGYSQNGHGIDAVRLYFQMLRSGLMPDQFTFGSIIKACSSLNDVELGKQLHAHVTKSESGSQLIAQNALIAMYINFGQITDASNMFSHCKTKNLISWSSIIAGFSQLGYEIEALCVFKEMLSHGIYQPNEYIFGSAFSACGSLQQPEYGRQVHGMIIKFGLRGDAFSGCSLTDMYAKCGFFHSAKTVFSEIKRPDLVSWNAIISGFAYGGDAKEAISIFSQMRRHLSLTPDDITVRSLLCACTCPSTLYQGKQVHSYIIKMSFDLNVAVCNSLLSMYARCSDLCDAFQLFNEMRSNADLVTWNAILTTCMLHNQAREVFTLFKMMLLSQTVPDHITLANILGACGAITSSEAGDQVHCCAVKIGLVHETSVMNGLIDMYSTCGFLESARKLFNCMENADVASWSSLIVGYAQFGHGEEALKLFRKMRRLGIKPNQVTFVGVLTACSHVGLVQEGWRLFNTMEVEHGIVPTREHCSCVVDLFARAGCINEAEAFINQIGFDSDIVVWKTLLAACRTHSNLEVGKRAAENILKIDPFNSAAYVLLCNIYASTGYWKDVARLRSLMRDRGIRKVPGQSWIEIKDRIHVFVAEDSLHQEWDKIYMVLEELWLQMLDAGYVPFKDMDFRSRTLWG
ncbi:unnamed protein product [Ilex paraguariensis]|uniref:Chlororespiratory reduction 21 n=1 Tax=Ilex paraguariensis TaxID=185542 RepID=A0ABC8UTN0_9AQUA